MTYSFDPTGLTQAGNPLGNLSLFAGGYSGGKAAPAKPVSTAIASGFNALVSAGTAAISPYVSALGGLATVATVGGFGYDVVSSAAGYTRGLKDSVDRTAASVYEGVTYAWNDPRGALTSVGSRLQQTKETATNYTVGWFFEYQRKSNLAEIGGAYDAAQQRFDQLKDASVYEQARAIGDIVGTVSLFLLPEAKIARVPRGPAALPPLALFDEAAPTTPPNSIVYTLEGRGAAKTARQQLAFDYEDSLIGAASDIETRRRIVPALEYNNPNPRGSNLVKFDAPDPLNPFTLIDRKLNVTTHKGQLDQFRRQAEALSQNPGYSLRIEVATEAALKAANRAIKRAYLPENVPITVKVVPTP